MTNPAHRHLRSCGDDDELDVSFLNSSSLSFETSIERGTCIKGLKWPPLEQKTEICFSQISLDSLSRRMAEV